MAGRVNPSRDLRLGLHALESGAIDREQLISAVADWATVPGRTLAEVFEERGILAGSTLAHMEQEVRRNRAVSGRDRDPSATVTYAGRPDNGRECDHGAARATSRFSGSPATGSRSDGRMRRAAWVRCFSRSIGN